MTMMKALDLIDLRRDIVSFNRDECVDALNL